jgi:hypothetical protein
MEEERYYFNEQVMCAYLESGYIKTQIELNVSQGIVRYTRWLSHVLVNLGLEGLKASLCWVIIYLFSSDLEKAKLEDEQVQISFL